MKNVLNLIITALGISLLIALAGGCEPKSKVESELSAKARQFDVIYSSSTTPIITEELGTVGSYYVVYSLKKDGVEYLIVADSNSNGGVDMIRHEPIVKPKVNMDSVVANSKWIPEYSMLGYTKAQPSKQSIESYHNPEKRPVPVGTEKEFIAYHTKE